MQFPIVPWADISSQYQRGTVLLGNGASIAVSPTFLYHSLLGHARQNGLLTTDVDRLFKFFSTTDFEFVLRLVWQASNVNRSLEIADERTHQAYVRVRDALIETVRAVHPQHSEVLHHLPAMYSFLKTFDTVLSLNYDLLTYWTMMYGLNVNDGHVFKDCFVSAVFDEDWRKFRNRIREQANTLVFYPHGSLALCRNANESEFKIQAGGASGLLEAILGEWRSERSVPLFVSEGVTAQKVASIRNSHYLSTVYREVLGSARHTLTLFGWGIGEHDRHLLKRMQNTGILRVAVSVLGNDQSYCVRAYQTIQEELGVVQVDFFDCQSPGCWIHP
jgi:hypothetical protein